METDLILHIHVKAIKLSNGRYSYQVTVIRQQRSRFRQTPFEMEEEKSEFESKEEAVKSGKKKAEEILRVKNVDAVIRFK